MAGSAGAGSVPDTVSEGRLTTVWVAGSMISTYRSGPTWVEMAAGVMAKPRLSARPTKLTIWRLAALSWESTRP